MNMKMQHVVVVMTVASTVSARRIENIFALVDPSTTSQNQPDNQDFDISSLGSNSSVSTIGEGTTQPLCSRDREMLLTLEDLRGELQDVNVQYLENASVDRACGGGASTRDDSNRECHLDFGYFSNNLHQVCEKHGGVYEEREHSLQCHSAKQKLYYQYDRFPNCFPASCEHTEVEDLVSKQMESVRQALEEDSGMTCYADFDILRHAGEVEWNVSVAGMTSRFSTVTTLLGLLLMEISNSLIG
jgi:hypothetical protein